MPRIRIDIPVLLLTTALVALATLSTTAVRSVAASEALTFRASVDFSNVQGSRGWSYRDSTGALLAYDATEKRWYGREKSLLLWAGAGHPGASLGAMRRWTAPQSGSIRVTGTVGDNDAGGGDGVEFVIRKNGSILWRQALANGNTTGVSFDLALSVAQNDALDFIVNRGPATNYWDTTWYDAVITYGTWSEPTVVADGTYDSSDDGSPNDLPLPNDLRLPAPAVEVSELHERLLGPVVPLAQWTDSIEQSAAAILANKPVNFLLTEPANSTVDYGWLGPNFYDRTASMYRYAAASGRADILDRARFYAREVSNNLRMANAECLIKTGDYEVCFPRIANRDNKPLGLAIAATDPRDPTTQAIALNGLARAVYSGFRAVSQTTFKDPRENGNGLLALALGHAVGPMATPARWGFAWDSAGTARTQMNTILAAQQPWGCWNTVYPTNGIIETPTYMQGLVLDGLAAYYDFVQADARIVPAITRCASWLRAKYRPAPNRANSDNRLGEGGWVYSYRTDGQTVVNGNVYPSLSGMIIGPLGWLWRQSRDARWYTLADAAFGGLVREGVAGPGTGINTSKEANQWARPIVNWISTR